MNRYHRGSSTVVASRFRSAAEAQLKVENSLPLRTIKNLDLFAASVTTLLLQDRLIYADAGDKNRLKN